MARGCADGQSHRKHNAKAETSFPKVSLVAIMISCAIDAKEGRYIAATNLTGALLHADMTEDPRVLLKGTIAELQTYQGIALSKRN